MTCQLIIWRCYHDMINVNPISWNFLLSSAYTDHQLGGITLLMPPFCLTVGGNLWQCNVNIRPRQYIKALLRPPDKLLWSIIIFVQSRPAFFPGSSDPPFCPTLSVANLFWSQSYASRHCMHITNSNQYNNHANRYPVSQYWKYWSVDRFGAF